MTQILGSHGYIGASPKTQNQGGIITLGGTTTNDVVTANLVIRVDPSAQSTFRVSGTQLLVNNFVSQSSPLANLVFVGNTNNVFLTTPVPLYDNVLTLGHIGTGSDNQKAVFSTTSTTRINPANCTVDIWFRIAEDYATKDYVIFAATPIGPTLLWQDSSLFIERTGLGPDVYVRLANTNTYNVQTSNAWTNIVFTMEDINQNTSIKLFVDGVKNANVTGKIEYSFLGANSTMNIDSAIIGSDPIPTSLTYKGYIGEVKMYDRLLSDDEVKKNYAALRERYD